jgi:peptidoglycan/xylan/chitin deacetylase (PgdA/CDA1 family)
MGIYPITPEQLKQKVESISCSGWRFGTQSDIIQSVEKGQCDEKIAIITFDDGLKEQISAIKHLFSMNVPAICFIPTALFTDCFVLDVHKLQMIRSITNDHELAEILDKAFGFFSHEFDDDLLEVQYRYDQPLSRSVKYFLNFVLASEQRDEWITTYFLEKFGDEKAAAEALYMNKDELKYLAKVGSIGSHGHSHRPLAKLSNAELNEELHRSREILETLTGVAPTGVSFPYGGKTAVNNDVFLAAMEAGYKYGFTMERGMNLEIPCALSLKRIDTNDIADWLNSNLS